jgi:Fe-S cluster biogenesis protein NfuA/nitrite reductase/ring-hydroxylating ferredoxin subunit
MHEDMQEQQRRAGRIETLIQEIDEFTDAHTRAVAGELVQSLLDMYGEGIARMLELIALADAPDYKLIQTLANDDLVSSLLLLHGLHPIDIETRIVQALDGVRPYLKSHGGNVEFVGVEDGVAYLRLEGSCHGCPSSTMTLKLTIEEAIYKAAPDLDRLEVEGVADPPRRPGIPVTFVPTRRQKDSSTTSPKEQSNGWNTVTGLGTLPAGTLKALTVAEEPLIFCQIEGTYYAYYNLCASCQTPLADSRLDGSILVCASCGQQYDVYHAGRSVDASAFFLEPIPLLVEDGTVKIALGDNVVLSAQAG